MQTELNHTVKSLFDKENLDELSREDLLLMTSKYPYSPILQFLYTRKLQLLQDLRYPASVAKTALYFSNPHWLHHQLRTRSSIEVLADMEKAYLQNQPATEVTEKETIVQTIEHQEPEIYTREEEVKADAGSIWSVEESADADLQPEVTSTAETEFTEPETRPLAEEQISVHEVAEIIKPENFFELTENIKPELTEAFISTEEPEFIPEPELIPPVEIPENVSEPGQEGIEQSSDNEEPTFIPEPEWIQPAEITQDAAEPRPTDIEQSSETDFPVITTAEPVFVETESDAILPEATVHEQAAVPVAEEKPEIIKAPIDTAPSETLEIPLEPLYAVDYFASQGIRLREEDQQDQLGKKLKSFTEWLKSMKKIHPEKSRDQFDAKTEAYIKSGADQSNDNAGVLTETMAEVLIKQGLIQKALEVYEKLSLLDPAKSATFAAKISELKAIGT